MMLGIKHCEYCGIAVGKKLGFICKPGFKYKDDRVICQACHQTAIKTIEQLTEVQDYVKKCFGQLDLKLDCSKINIQFQFKPEIEKIVAGNNVVGYASFVIHRHKVDSSIVVLYGMPKLLALTTLAHELGHVWCKENSVKFKPDNSQEEGFCNVLSCLVLHSLPMDADVRHRIKSLFKNTDPIYGGYFRDHWKSLETLTWPVYKQIILSNTYV